MTSDDLRFLRHEFSNGFVFFVHTHTFALCHCCAQGLWSICCAYMCQFHALLGRFCNCNIFFGWCPPLVSNLVWTSCVVCWPPPLVSKFVCTSCVAYAAQWPTNISQKRVVPQGIGLLYVWNIQKVSHFLKRVFMHWIDCCLTSHCKIADGDNSLNSF